jgi:hypothetical protein
MVPFFRKNSQVRQLRLNLNLGQVQSERVQPSRKDARVGDSLRLQQDTALLPRLSDLPKSRKEHRNGVTRKTKSFTYIYRNVASKYLFITWPRGLLTVKIRQPSHEFTFSVGISFIPYPLVLTPVV